MGSIPAEATHVLQSEAPRARPSEDWKETARSWLVSTPGTVHLVGVGNPIRQDDAVGVAIVAALRRSLGSRPAPNVVIHPPCFMPERLLSKVAATGGSLMVFDAVEANMEPGAVVCASLADTKFGFFATHNVPLRLIPEVAGSLGGSFVVGVQPEWLGVGEELSVTAQAAKSRVVAAMSTIIGGMRDGHA